MIVDPVWRHGSAHIVLRTVIYRDLHYAGFDSTGIVGDPLTKTQDFNHGGRCQIVVHVMCSRYVWATLGWNQGHVEGLLPLPLKNHMSLACSICVVWQPPWLKSWEIWTSHLWMHVDMFAFVLVPLSYDMLEKRFWLSFFCWCVDHIYPWLLVLGAMKVHT